MLTAPALKTGIGFRTPHVRAFLSTNPDPGFVEVHSENYFGDGGQPLAVLERVRMDHPISFHGVGLSLGSAQAPHRDHLDRLTSLVSRFEPMLVSEHLAWTGIGGHFMNDLLPVPYTEEALEIVAANISTVQDRLRRRILIENPSSYLEFNSSVMSEQEFLVALARRSGCGFLLDVNNIYVSAVNHGWDAGEYLRAIPAELVGEIHLAGHEVTPDLLIDTHSRTVSPAVWRLYRETLRLIGDKPTLIEWDADLPPLDALLGEAERADVIRQSIIVEERHAA